MLEEKTLIYNELAIASFAVGTTSFIQLIGLEKSITAIVFGILAIRRLKRDRSKSGRNLAIAGVVLGGLYTIIALALIPDAIAIAKSVMRSI